MQVPFGEWLPDQPEHNNPGANVANNVYCPCKWKAEVHLL